MMADLCILIPTFEKYRAVADFTRQKLDQHWPGHPPIFLCGLPEQAPGVLPLRDDPADWMMLVRSAVEDLQARGFRRCYLILDDHPPVDTCHAVHLNETLPGFMEKLGASFINLQGWGQYRPTQGRDLGPAYFYMERPGRDYLWKFALHPGLWDLKALTAILDLLLQDPNPAEHTCWKFERRAGDREFPLPSRLVGAAYRVCGLAMIASPARQLRALLRSVELFAFDVARFFIRIFGGQPARDRFDARYLGVYHFYDGPYPLFWSGLMKKRAPESRSSFFPEVPSPERVLA